MKNRSFRVRYQNSLSEIFKTYQGIPQGSVLSPTLFSLYLTGIKRVVSPCQIGIFADDIIVWDHNSDLTKLENTLNDTLEKIQHFADEHKLAFNTTKSLSCLFTTNRHLFNYQPKIFLKGQLLESAKTPTYLGFTLDTEINCSKHISRLCEKGRKRLQLLKYISGRDWGANEHSKVHPFLASSVTPWHDGKGLNVSIPVNPSVRLIHYSQADAELLDYDQYYLNLTKANSMKNRSKQKKNIYELLYTFTKAYDVPDLSTESLVKVYELLKNNQTIYNSFFTFLTAAEKTVGCDSSCTVAQLCSMSCISSSEYDMCFKNINNDVSVKHISNPNFKNSIVLYVSICVTLICVAVLFFIIYKKFWSSSSRSEYTPFSSF
ncbi:putative RNA-directed DNA polymerase from transposon BS [Caerostris extrusa]|uniref:RNA-directed DNA polymerase from transposon BS n=1 Tax=Caerostris extrusa TaxID=172846 RepID=A0AAV4M955_CAEEX|nr:putative RNA-directed DNA polymerase from transposon BS [Caerostris extrusa]